MIAYYTIWKTLSQEFETAGFRKTRKAVWYLNSIPQKNTSAVRLYCLTLEVLSYISFFY
ncbi:ArsR family transcriptional regulator [Streptococcus salivarius]|nr:ArsR family transcriptional regulator [Streptococcus salivarius]